MRSLILRTRVFLILLMKPFSSNKRNLRRKRKRRRSQFKKYPFLILELAKRRSWGHLDIKSIFFWPLGCILVKLIRSICSKAVLNLLSQMIQQQLNYGSNSFSRSSQYWTLMVSYMEIIEHRWWELTWTAAGRILASFYIRLSTMQSLLSSFITILVVSQTLTLVELSFRVTCTDIVETWISLCMPANILAKKTRFVYPIK